MESDSKKSGLWDALNDLDKKTEVQKKTKEFRYALQEFMNDNADIFSGLSEALNSPENLISRDNDGFRPKTEALKFLVENSKELSVLAASYLYGKPVSEVDKIDVKPFRRSSASLVASAWKQGTKIDIDSVAKDVAKAAELANPDMDFNQYRYLKMDPKTTLMMTAASVAMRLSVPVISYDFRANGKINILKILSEKVLETADESASQMLGSDAGPDDRSSLLQTLSNHLADIMASCYKKKTFYTLQAIKDKTNREIDEYFSKRDPVSEILNDFNKWSVFFAGSAFAYARGLQSAREKTKEEVASHRMD